MSGDDHQLAADLANRAGRLLVELRARRGFTDPLALRGAGDLASHQFLTKELARFCPADAVLSEHGSVGRRSTASRVWIIDPLDGTREYGEAGRADWAVQVALWESGFLVAAAVALPARALVLCTPAAEVPVFPMPPGSRLRIASSRTRPPAFLERLLDVTGAQSVPMGSAGVKIASVLLGEVDAYVHAGGQYEWDSAAPVAVARSAGLHTSRLDGAPLVYNQPNPWLPDLVVCRPESAARLLAAIAATLNAEEVQR